MHNPAAIDTLKSNDAVIRYMPLVHRIAKGFAIKVPINIDRDDLIQAGMVGLLEAWQRFELRDAQFETYANTRIRGAMLDHLRAHDWIPRKLRRSSRAVEKAIAALHQQDGQVIESRVANDLQMPVGDYQALRAELDNGQLLYGDEISKSGESFFAAIEAPDSDPLTNLISAISRKSVITAVGRLPARLRMLLSLYYHSDLSYREAGVILGLQQARVWQLHALALEKLRVILEAESESKISGR